MRDRAQRALPGSGQGNQQGAQGGYGMRDLNIADLDGNTLAFGQPIAEQ